MTVKEFYQSIQGNYDDALSRLRDENRIRRYLGMFAKDTSAQQLKAAVESSNWQEAFRAAHTLKGVASNMSFQHYFEIVYALTEALRPCQPLDDAGMNLYREAMACHEAVISGIEALSAGE